MNDEPSAHVHALLDRDPASRHMGMKLVRVEEDLAEVRMAVTDFMINGHGTCHGGFVFALADSAFAFACNARGPVALTQHLSVTFLRPVQRGDELVAQARVVEWSGRTAVCEVMVRRGAELVADVRGLCRLESKR